MQNSALHKYKSYCNFFCLPLLIISASVLLNIEKFEASFIKASVHVLFQSLLIYGLIAFFQKWMLIRVILATVISIGLFSQLTYDAPLSVSVVMSVLNSSADESISFIKFNLFIFLISCLFLAGMVLFKIPTNKLVNTTLMITGIAYLILPTLAYSQALYSSLNYKHTLQTGLARGESEFVINIKYALQDIARRFPPLSGFRGVTDIVRIMSQQKSLSSSWTGVSSENSTRVLVIGIGESLRADNLGIYGYARNTTPHLSKLSNHLNIYSNTYSAGTNTWSSIPATLTKSITEPDLSKSIINLAKDAGYETYWFSNHAESSQWDFSVSSIAKQSDHVYFSSSENAGKNYDVILLEKLLETLQSTNKNRKILIVLHYYGSHMEFSDRYPEKYARFSGSNTRLNHYDNSILYTDFIQGEVIDIVSKYGGEYLFFSDHGLGDPDGAIPLKHDVRDHPDIGSIKVPFFIWPKQILSMNSNDTVSLFHFECIFAEWAKISANELSDGSYCQNALDNKNIKYFDSNLKLHEVSLADHEH